MIATKLGWEYDDGGRLVSAHTPERLRAAMERDLRLLGADAISIVHLRWGGDRSVSEPFRRAVAAMIEMRQEGKLRHLGLSNVGLAQLEYALTTTEIRIGVELLQRGRTDRQRDSRFHGTPRHRLSALATAASG